ncbi:MAG: hypothetical protein IJG15_06015, partial [Lachnospiraceae bacterium]|nr:hypothetical protein [Lachnospiraceae bacterium]
MTAIAEKRSDVLYVKMLGGFSMSYNGKTIAGSSKSSISQNNALLQILIHAREKGVTRDRLEELLFGDRDVDNAHHSLRSVIYNAKKYLEKLRSEALAEAERDGVAIRVSNLTKSFKLPTE